MKRREEKIKKINPRVGFWEHLQTLKDRSGRREEGKGKVRGKKRKPTDAFKAWWNTCKTLKDRCVHTPPPQPCNLQLIIIYYEVLIGLVTWSNDPTSLPASACCSCCSRPTSSVACSRKCSNRRPSSRPIALWTLRNGRCWSSRTFPSSPSAAASPTS